MRDLKIIVASVLLLAGCEALEEKAATSPLVGAAEIAVEGEGRVQAKLRAGRYTYVRLADSLPGTWHVVSGHAPNVGDVVYFRGYAELHDFSSPTLKRSFERLIFSSIKPLSGGPHD